MGVNIFASELRGTVKKEVDFIPGAYVVFYDDVTIGAISTAEDAKDSGKLMKGLEMLISQIAEWNFEDNGVPIPINLDSFKKFSFKLVSWLFTAQGEVLSTMSITEDKKKE